MAKLVLDTGRSQVWEVNGEFYVYGVRDSGDPVVCPSLGMAREVAAGGL